MILSIYLAKNRFTKAEHLINVMKVWNRWPGIMGAINKARIAAILHDCGKIIKEMMLSIYQKIPYIPDEIGKIQPKLLHGVIGKHLAMTKYNIGDQEILEAIRWHTTGRAGMSVLENHIYC